MNDFFDDLGFDDCSGDTYRIDDFDNGLYDDEVESITMGVDDGYSDDLFDRAIDFPNVEDRVDSRTLGLSLALSSEMHDIERKAYSVDSNTDAENMRQAMRLTSLSNRTREGSRLRPFEQYVDDICKGRRRLFEE